jgi:hypothetical protein
MKFLALDLRLLEAEENKLLVFKNTIEKGNSDKN